MHDARNGFHVLGRADEAMDVLAEARVLLAPLRFGAGLKGKLIEAMQCGTPSVTSSIGAEAMHGDLPWPGEIADDAMGFAEAAVQLHNDKGSWLRAQKRGTGVLEVRYSKETWEEALIHSIEKTYAGLSRHREANCLGSMFRYHSMRSTEFMSRWIEEKGRGQG